MGNRPAPAEASERRAVGRGGGASGRGRGRSPLPLALSGSGGGEVFLQKRTSWRFGAALPPAEPLPPPLLRGQLPPPQTALSPRASRLCYGDLQPQRRGEQLGPPGSWRRRPAPEARGPQGGLRQRRWPGEPRVRGRPQLPWFGFTSHQGGGRNSEVWGGCPSGEPWE